MKDRISIEDYSYVLPDDRIASHPLENRDQSKLLVYRKGVIHHSKFSQLADFLDSTSSLYFNDTRVIPARLHFRKATGALIEVLLVTPHDPKLVQSNMASNGPCSWNCMIGNQKRWKAGTTLEKKSASIKLSATLLDNSIVEFKWQPLNISFAEVIHALGDTPLPPYIKRETTTEDVTRYQTVYAHHRGAVAAPTAGLHFTDSVMNMIKAKGILMDFVTLHVSAGTFLPIKHENALEHTMHEEQVVIPRDTIDNLLSGRKVVAVGTTSLRTLESLYWYGCKLAADPNSDFVITQNDPYEIKDQVAISDSLQNIKRRFGTAGQLNGRTSIYIRPGYEFKVCDALITNFHQPGSTLILLVAAFAGPEWKKLYGQALDKGYRFLSYGDSSLIFRS